ncbi:MAG TPA: hypothetical protein VKT21_05205 [Thermoplasmata archaeon]|nr:hypothetical protein [Thermoplasmata archaeon]
MGAELSPTRRLQHWPRAPDLIGTVARVAEAFPELEGVRIRVDLLPSGSRRLGTASILEHPPRVAFHPHLVERPQELAATAAHEFMHLLQWPLHQVPNGERACDLYVLARFGTRFRGPPYYLDVPRRARDHWDSWAPLASDLARQALEERRHGRRQYLRWWEDEFRSRVPLPPAALWGPEGAPTAP